MKCFQSIFFLLFCLQTVSAQTEWELIQRKLTSLTDQFDKPFTARQDRLVLIYVPGADDPFTKVYDKWKSKQWKDAAVQVVGGFQELVSEHGHGGANSQGMKGHIREAMNARYGRNHFSILLDMQNEVARELGLKGFSILIMSRRGIEKKEDFGNDRKQFFDAIQTYFK